MVEASLVFGVIQTLGILIGVMIALLQIRDIKETRQAELFMQIYDRFDENYGNALYTLLNTWEWKNYEEFMDKYGEVKNPEIWSRTATKTASYFTGIGVLVKRGMIDPTLVYDLMASHVVRVWEKMEPVIIRFREEYKSEKWKNIEHLYNVMQSLSDQR